MQENGSQQSQPAGKTGLAADQGFQMRKRPSSKSHASGNRKLKDAAKKQASAKQKSSTSKGNSTV